MVDSSSILVIVTDGESVPEQLTSTATNAYARADYDLSLFYYDSADLYVRTNLRRERAIVTFDSSRQDISITNHNSNTNLRVCLRGRRRRARVLADHITDAVGFH